MCPFFLSLTECPYYIYDMGKSDKDIEYDISLGSKLYLIDDLSTPKILYDILSTVYPRHKHLYYMVGDERPYSRSDFYTIQERRKVIIERFLNRNKNND